MKANRNQEAINEFFEGYGFDTIKEYGQTFFDLISLLQQKQITSNAFAEDLTGKLSSMYRLISALEREESPALTIEQLN